MPNNFHYSLQSHNFCLNTEYTKLREQQPSTGAIVTFTGLVRDFSKEQTPVIAVELSTYPTMTKTQLHAIGKDVMQRFTIDGLRIIHRYGTLKPSDQIVFVGVASKHRKEAFSAAQMTMDFLKSQTAFWKKEIASDNESWIEPSQDDIESLKQWQK